MAAGADGIAGAQQRPAEVRLDGAIARRDLERATEVRRRRGRVAAGEQRGGRLAQQRGRAGQRPRRGVGDVRGDARDRRAAVVQRERRARVQRRALAGTELGEHGLAHDGLHEHELPAIGGEDLGADERVDRRREASSRSSAIAAASQRSPRAPSTPAAPASAIASGDRRASTEREIVAGPRPATAAAVAPSSSAMPRASSSSSSRPARNGLPALAACTASTSAGRGGRAAQRRQLGDGVARQRRGHDPLPVARRAEVRERPGALARRARRDQQHDRQVGEAPGEVGEEAQRRQVGPLRIVDADQQRALRREVGGDPPQRVQRAADRGVAARGLGGRLVDRRQGRAGRTGEQLRAGLAPGGSRDRALDHLAHDRPRHRALELVAARLEATEAAHLRERPHVADEARLADPRRPLDDDHPAAARGRVVERGGDAVELVIALERVRARRSSRRAGEPIRIAQRRRRARTARPPAAARRGGASTPG